MNPITFDDVKRLVVNDGDLIILETDDHMRADVAVQIRDRLRQLLAKDVRVVVLDGGMRIAAVLAKADADAATPAEALKL